MSYYTRYHTSIRNLAAGTGDLKPWIISTLGGLGASPASFMESSATWVAWIGEKIAGEP